MSESNFKEVLDTAEHLDNLLLSGEIHANKAEMDVTDAPEISPALNDAEIRKNIVEVTASTEDTSLLEKIDSVLEEPEPIMSASIPETAKSISGPRELKKLQQLLPQQERVFSKVIHQSVIQSTSEVVGKTISRPSGLLGGGLVAFIGSSSYFVLAKYIGFRYNYSLSLALFVGGFLIGIFLELFAYFAKTSKNTN